MIGQHLRTFLWLRWRLRVNQLKKGGIANIVILSILAALMALASLFMFAICFVAGWMMRPAWAVLVAWDALIVGFLIFSVIGVLTDLQRSEALSLDKMLHLPVSLTSAFVVNFLSSLLSPSILIFLPGMVGMTLGLSLSRGPVMLLLLFPAVALLIALKALIYQFQGWLASLMVNKRRRQTIIVMVSVTLFVLLQLPNLFNIMRVTHGTHGPSPEQSKLTQDQAKLDQAFKAGAITADQLRKQKDQLNDDLAAQDKADDARAMEIVRTINMVVPPGWVALAAWDLASGSGWSLVLGTAGLALIAALSLWRAYGTTMRYYTGAYTAAKKAKPVAAPSAPKRKTAAAFMERKLPWLSEPATAITLACFRSLLRAPEAKMLLLSPILMVVIFGSMILTSPMDPPENLRILFPIGAMAMILLSLVSVAGNQFGFDRNGFRVYVLCPATREDILLGKNLALVPIAVVMAGVPSVLLAILFPLRPDHFLTIPLQWLSMMFVFFILANLLSILAPAAIAPGSLKPMQTKGLLILLNLAFVFIFPVALSLTLLPWGLELLLHSHDVLMGWPVCLILTCVECAGLGLLYRLVIHSEGQLLQGREQRILELVTVKSE